MAFGAVLAEAWVLGRRLLLIGMVAEAIVVATLFPTRHDAPQVISAPEPSDQNFYDQAYVETGTTPDYVEAAREAAGQLHIREAFAGMVQQYNLSTARVLEVGAGAGLLQDEVADYTALDLSGSARRYFHKPFVQADARRMPFQDGEFDSIWSVWVLEHVPNPEMALVEMRRVVKPHGLLILAPAWLCSAIAGEGLHARPYQDLGWRQRLSKASGLVRDSVGFQHAYLLPIRSLRWLGSQLSPGPTTFRYWPLTPNYNHYWEPDSDAVNSLDRYEMALWFRSRGDECLNCASLWTVHGNGLETLIIRVNKSAN